jgi:putative addiction module component (TIGR02574 family)
MSSTELSLAALELSPDERLELARRLVESVIEPASVKEAVAEGVRRIEDVASGRVQGLTQDQYRAALG